LRLHLRTFAREVRAAVRTSQHRSCNFLHWRLSALPLTRCQSFECSSSRWRRKLRRRSAVFWTWKAAAGI